MKSYWNLTREQQAQVARDPAVVAARATFATLDAARGAAYVAAIYASYDTYDAYDALLDDYDSALRAAYDAVTLAREEAAVRMFRKGN